MANNTTLPVDPRKLYPYCELGYILPLVDETNMPVTVRMIVYFIALLWSFLGVAIVADIFMCAIEVITSKKTTVTVANQDNTSKRVEVRVWNDTIANLTLMALGSSAPEIILNVIEIIGNDFYAGELGPGTIVGSAAFNLLIIVGFCIYAIPNDAVRRVNRFSVYGITAFASVFAYIWLLIILKINTAGTVELWEAIVTFLFFPLLVILAYMADINLLFCCKRPLEDAIGTIGYHGGEGQEDLELIDNTVTSPNDTKLIQEFMAQMNHNPAGIDEATAAAALAHKLQGEKQSHSRAYYRVKATRMLTAGAKIDGNTRAKQIAKTISNDGIAAITYPIIDFACSNASVLEDAGTVELVVVRTGNESKHASVRYESIDGTATAGEDYVKVEGILAFLPGEKKKAITVIINDDDQWEPDETFFIKLSSDPNDTETKLGKQSINQVTIINDDDPGTFEFTEPSYICKESEGKISIPVRRFNGCDGTVKVTWYTTDMSAKVNLDYKPAGGVLTFEHGESTKHILIDLIQTPDKEPDENFRVTLKEVCIGAKLGVTKATVITIVGDAEFKSMVNRVVAKTHIALKQMQLGHESWSDQFVKSMNVNGGDIENATGIDYVMHFLSFGFKTIFAIIPPPNILGGWACFFGALSFIAIFTLLISDLANIFGCLIGLKPAVNAITLVAMGTSLPDLFASKTAAVQEEHADNSLGNVTGSNSVNVFLGLGLPWSIAAIYWTIQDGQFHVPPGTLGFSVTLFTICAILGLALLYVRRTVSIFGNAELGGPMLYKSLSFGFMVLLWFIYVLFSALQTYEVIDGF